MQGPIAPHRWTGCGWLLTLVYPHVTLAVYTTIYPGVEAYLADWYRSLRRQTDQDFELWIGLDMLKVESVRNMLGSDLKANWIVAPSGATSRTCQATGLGTDS